MTSLSSDFALSNQLTQDASILKVPGVAESSQISAREISLRNKKTEIKLQSSLIPQVISAANIPSYYLKIQVFSQESKKDLRPHFPRRWNSGSASS